jgi:hypothetical protein
VFEYLLDLGVSANVVDHKGYSVLHCAAAGGRHRLVERLCSDKSLRVDIYLTISSGEDAAIMAANNGFKELSSRITRKMYIGLRRRALIHSPRES